MNMGTYSLQTDCVVGSAVVICLLTLSACVSTSQFPILPLESDQDASLSCEELENELLRANAFRDAILEEEGDVLATELATDVADGAMSVVMADPLGAVISGVGGSIRYRQRYRQYQEVVSAAEARMIHVLTLREARQCPAGPSGDSTRAEQQILAELHGLDQRLSAEEVSEQAYREERRELLDALR